MRNAPYYFISVAILQALVGMGVGIYMGITRDFVLAPAHAHNNLLGWVGMAIFGIVYAVVPELGAKRLVTAHFWIALAGNIILPIGIGLVVTGQGETLSVVGSLVEVVNMLVFGFIVWTGRAAFSRQFSK